MKRIPLSERFSHIKAVTVDNTESETDFSDNDLIPRSSSNTFNYSHTASLSFAGNTVHKTVEEDLEHEDSDEEMFDMENGWMEHFQKILLKSRNLSGEHEIHVSLCDKVPQIDNSLPLQCLKNSLDQYNKLSQGSDDVSEDLTTDDLTIERNEMGMDICEDNGIDEIANENVANFVVENEVEEIENVNVDDVNDDSHADKTEIPSITEPVQVSVVNSKTDLNKTEMISGSVPINVFSNDTNADKDDIGPESVQIATKLKPELEDAGNNKTADELETPCIQEPLSKTENEAVAVEEKMETRVETIELEDCKEIPVESNRPIEDTAEKTNVLESLNAFPLNIQENEKNISNLLLMETQHIDRRKSKETIQSELSEQLSLETVRTAIIHQESSTKELNEVETRSATNLDETNADEKKKDVSVQLPDSSISKQDKEKTQNKKSVTYSDTKLKNVSQKYNKEKVRNSSVSQPKKDTTKVKTFEIKPTFSFPLDELLPPVAKKKGKVSEDINTTVESAAVARKRHTSETIETKQIAVLEEVVSYPVTLHPLTEGDIFHGTVYDSSPKEDLSETLHLQQSNFEDLNRIPLQSGSGVDTFVSEFDTGMANLIAALQNGNQQVISMFQAALHDQIGSNLEALAFKARQGQQLDPNSDNKSPSSFGFYTERKDCVGKDPDETGDNLTNEKYDELLDLFVEQCSALVKTDEDRCKLKSLMKVLQKEGEMKLNSTGFTPPPEIEQKTTHDDIPDSLNLSTVPSGLDSCQVDSNLLDKHEVELFEGRTLLKGGVEPRHIPKTTIRKSGQDPPKDPRTCLTGERRNSLVKVPLPNFAVELYGENRVKKMLHLDWNTQFSLNRNQLALIPEKDPRTNKVSPINSELKLIVDATKTLVETLHSSIENKTKQVDKIPVTVDQKLTSEITHSKGTENVKTKTIPVLITPQKGMVTTRALDSSKDRNSVLHCIDLKNNEANASDKLEKKFCVGVVKPLIEKYKPKDVKPSVGIVKPILIQSKTPSIKQDTKLKGNTFTPSVSSRPSFNMEQDFDIEDGEIQVDKDTQVVEKIRDKISLSGTHQQIVSMAQNSDPEEGEIRIDEARLVGEKGKTGTKSEHHMKKCHKINKGEVESKSGHWHNKIATRHMLENASNTNKVNISLSDVSSYEDGQIDTDLDKSFKEEVPVVIKDRARSKNKDGSSRHYRKRDRSSSRSSVDSRLSHTSRTRYCEEERKYNTHESTGRGNSREKSKRRDRSRSRDRTRLRNPSEEKSNSKHKHRHRHHTNKDERSYRENSVQSETVKRHHSVGDEKRKRHKTDEDSQLVKFDGNRCSGDIYSKPATSQRVTSVYGETGGNELSIQKTNFPQTTSILYPNTGAENLSDAEISKEYHEKFGKYRKAHPSTSETDRLTFSNSSSNSLAGKEYSYLTASKSRRKSWEDQQRQVLEDKKFLEKCKQKFLGKTSTVYNQSTKYNSSKQSESTISKPKLTSCASSYKEMHCLEDGEI